MPLAGRVVAAVTGGMLHRRLDRLYDDCHGGDQLAESFGRPGFAGDVNAGVRAARDWVVAGDRDVGRCRRWAGGDRPLDAVAFG
jgi:hypothetical protein